MLALHLLVKKNGTLPSSQCLEIQQDISILQLRANAQVLTTQLSEMYNEKRVEEGHKPTAGHSYLFSNNPKWLILVWVAAGVQISDDHTVQKK